MYFSNLVPFCAYDYFGFHYKIYLAYLDNLIRTTNREVRGSNPGQGRNLVQDFCFTCRNREPTQLWWVHWLHAVSRKIRRWGRELAARPHMKRPRKWSRWHFISYGCPRASWRDYSSSSIRTTAGSIKALMAAVKRQRVYSIDEKWCFIERNSYRIFKISKVLLKS